MKIWGFSGKRGETVTVLSDEKGPIASVRCRGHKKSLIAVQLIATAIEIDELTAPVAGQNINNKERDNHV
jgi:hypothetical protein